MSRADKDLKAIGSIIEALDSLEDPEAVSRVMRYVLERYGLNPGIKASGSRAESVANQGPDSLADLFEQVQPEGEQLKALTVAYWFQLTGAADWDALSLNGELKNLGHHLSNVTKTLTRLMQRRPQLVIQTRKAGSAKQARKRYKLTREGQRIIDDRLTNREAGVLE